MRSAFQPKLLLTKSSAHHQELLDVAIDIVRQQRVRPEGRTDSDLPCNLMLQCQFALYDHSAGLLSFRTLETVSLDGCEITEVSEELDSTIALPSLLHTRLSYLSVSLSLCSVLIKKPLRDYFRFGEIVENIWQSA